MGSPRFGWDEIPLAYAMDTAAMPVGWEELQEPGAVNVGNPHVVFFVGDADAVDLARLGPIIEHDPLFPERVNVNVASFEGDAHPPAGLGAGRGAHRGLRHRRLRDRGRRDPEPADRRPGRGPAAGRRR